MLTIRLLGEQSVVDAETGRISSRSTRTLALLGLLIQQTGTPVTRASIAGQFWPESGEVQALTNLRRELHALRRLLGDDDSLEVTGQHLCWHDRQRHHIDLADFLREREVVRREDQDDVTVVEHGPVALRQYAGDLLPAVDDPWVARPRAALREACLELCAQVAEAAGRTGQPDIAAAALGLRIRLEPYDEQAHRSLMRLQVRLGGRGVAIGTYHRLAAALERDLGVAPDPETTAVLSEIVGGPLPTASPAAPEPPRQHRQTPLAGRRDELESLLATWDTVTRGRPQIVLVRGGAGVGKTRLVAELASRVRRQSGTFGGTRCFDTSGRVSLAPVADWLREPTIAAHRSRVERIWSEEADRLAPPESVALGDIPSQRAPLVRSATGPDVWQRHRFFEGLARSLLAATPPLVLVLDDLQWCDEDTLAFLTFLLSFEARSRLLVVTTARPGERLAAMEPWLARLREPGLLRELDLGPLGQQETGALAAELSGLESLTPEATALLHAATGGIPLYIVEAARAGVATSLDGATTVGWQRILRSRLQQASPAGRDVAMLAAAVGRDFTLALLAEASDLDSDTLVLAVDELWRLRIVSDFREGYDFTHDLLRSAAYDLVTPARRWLLHRRLAAAFEQLYEGRTEVVAAQIAEHYRLAGDSPRAIAHYRDAARSAAAVFAHVEALSLLDRALAMLAAVPAGRDRDLRELELLELASPPTNAEHGYSSSRQRRVCERSVELAGRLGESTREVTAMVGLWASHFVAGRLRESFAVAQQAVAAAGPGHPRFGQAHFSLAGSALHLGDTALSLEHFAVARAAMSDEPLSFGTRAQVHTMAWWAHACWTAGDVERAAALADEATAEARRTGHRYTLAVARSYEAVTRQLRGDRRGCQEAAAEVRTLCRRYQFSYYSEWGRILEGWAGGGPAGRALIEEGIARLEAQGACARMPYWLGLLAETATNRRSAARVVARAGEVAARQGERWQVPTSTVAPAGLPAQGRARP